MRRILREKFRLKTSEKRNPLFGTLPGFEPEPTRARARGFTKSAIMPAHNLTDPKRVVRTTAIVVLWEAYIHIPLKGRGMTRRDAWKDD